MLDPIVIDKFIEDGLSVSQMAAEFECDWDTVYRALKRLGKKAAKKLSPGPKPVGPRCKYTREQLISYIELYGAACNIWEHVQDRYLKYGDDRIRKALKMYGLKVPKMRADRIREDGTWIWKQGELKRLKETWQ